MGGGQSFPSHFIFLPLSINWMENEIMALNWFEIFIIIISVVTLYNSNLTSLRVCDVTVSELSEPRVFTRR